MSVRNMLKVVMSLLTVSLIAITLATTTAHASRLHQSTMASKNLPYAAGELNAAFDIPFYVCQNICTGSCVCNRPHPCIATCGCVKNPTKEVAAAAAIAAQQMAKVKSDFCLVPYAECSDKCPGGCVCSLITPPPEYCFCSIIGTSTAAELQVKGKGKSSDDDEEDSDVIPYTECIKNCDHCACTLKWPPESNVCVCLESDMRKKPAAFELEAKELHKKLELLAGPVEKIRGGGFIPYPECIAKCDRCTTCTRNLPIEASFCVCENDDDSKKQTIKNSGEDDKKIVLWTKAKMDETISYEKCMKTCDLCACTLPYPPERARCICVTPKHDEAASGKALPM